MSNEIDFMGTLIAALSEYTGFEPGLRHFKKPDDDETPDVAAVRSFEAEGLLTSDTGFVVELGDGRTFNITVQEGRNRWGR